MAFCTKCGAQFEAGTAFCGNCGTAVAATPAIQPTLSEDTPQKKTTIFLIALAVLVIAGFLIFFIKHSSYSAINTVRDGYLDYNRTTTVGKALDHAFQQGKWKTFRADNGATIVEYDAKASFSQLYRVQDASAGLCQIDKHCQEVLDHLFSYCKSEEALSKYPSEDDCVTNGLELAKPMQFPVAIQFSINNDHSFQVAAMDPAWSVQDLLTIMYDR